MRQYTKRCFLQQPFGMLTGAKDSDSPVGGRPDKIVDHPFEATAIGDAQPDQLSTLQVGLAPQLIPFSRRIGRAFTPAVAIGPGHRERILEISSLAFDMIGDGRRRTELDGFLLAIPADVHAASSAR